MADNNYTAIKPIQGLQNIGGLTPVEQRKERKRRQPRSEDEEQQEPTNETNTESPPESSSDAPAPDHSIDFRA